MLKLRGPRRRAQGVESLIDHTKVPVSKLLRLCQWSVSLLNTSAYGKRDIGFIGGGNCESKILMSQLCDEAALVVAMRWRARFTDFYSRDWMIDLARYVSGCRVRLGHSLETLPH